MLSSKHPDPLEMDRYLGHFSEHRRSVHYSIGQGPRFRMPRNASFPGPGHYKTDRDWPENEEEECSTRFVTRVKVAPKFSIPTDERSMPDGTLKGIWTPKTNELGPGQYNQHLKFVRSKEKSLPVFTIPRSKETAEALRERKQKADVPGPGVYALTRSFDDSGREKTKAMERAVRRGTGCWASAQYTHIFACMKPPREDSRKTGGSNARLGGAGRSGATAAASAEGGDASGAGSPPS
eukprot:TRINITY_DN5806_c0_g1_i1.p1 TRINITY_DN5806_c0_g1~~TRINITY_DN5806_c0_g1_i1.p1  ORF type:complete len:237 (+),score=32.17 TRINITY_DN5806_c0_g1_i1:139-849(+)